MYPLVAAVIWGITFPVLADALPQMDALHLTAARYGLATLIFVALLVAREGRAALSYQGRFAEALALGAAGFVGFNLLANLALAYASPQHVALFAATTPVITQFVRWVRDGVRPRPVLLGLSGVAFLGVGLVMTGGRLAGLSNLGGGVLIALAGVVCWALYTHGGTRFAEWSPLRFTTLTAIGGALTLAVLVLGADVTGLVPPPAPGAWLAVAPHLAYVVLFGAVVGVLAWNTGVQRLGAANAALFMNLVPVTTFVVQILRGYRPVPAELIGALVTVAALVAANLVTRRTATAPAAPAAPAAELAAVR
jgi:drug/metabolite transporter (DMT)-like permease